MYLSDKRIDLSIIIVSMNKVEMLFNCLNSILDTVNEIRYEIIVVAYMFESHNLDLLKNRYPNIIIIINNTLAGFSENNNFGAKIAKGSYCLILNDDTLIKEPLIDELYSSFKKLEIADIKAAILSPVLFFPDGVIQYNGRDKSTYIDFIITKFKLSFINNKNKYSNKQNVYQTYNISGACFMINTDIFRELGFFDEKYFFCPEDIALSTLANEKGYKVFVNANLSIYHLHRSSSKSIIDIITPVEEIGECLFYGRFDNRIRLLLKFVVFIQALIKLFYWLISIKSKDRIVNIKAYKNTLLYIFSNYSPKELFIKLYQN